MGLLTVLSPLFVSACWQWTYSLSECCQFDFSISTYLANFQWTVTLFWLCSVGRDFGLAIFSGLFSGTVLQNLVISGQLLVVLRHCFDGSSFLWHALGCFLALFCQTWCSWVVFQWVFLLAFVFPASFDQQWVSSEIRPTLVFCGEIWPPIEVFQWGFDWHCSFCQIFNWCWRFLGNFSLFVRFSVYSCSCLFYKIVFLFVCWGVL